MTHAVEEPNEVDEPNRAPVPYERTRWVAFWLLVIADAASVVIHGPNLGHVLMVITASRLLYAGNLGELTKEVLSRWPKAGEAP